MLIWVIEKVAEGLNGQKKLINGNRILVLGIAYKKNVDDMRKSPSVEILKLPQVRGALVDYSDSYVPVFKKNEEVFIRPGEYRLNTGNGRQL